MLWLDANNTIGYLRDRGWLAPDARATVRALGWGVSNVVFRVEAAGQSLVIKQARAQLRTPEPWFSNLDRAFREAEIMRLLAGLLPAGVVPRVLFEDRENYAFGMTAAPDPHVVWKQSLLAGQVDLELGRQAGRILGTIHARTAANRALAAQFEDNQVFIQLRVDPFYWRLRPSHPQAAVHIQRVVDEMFHTRVCVTHADFSPKNILVHSQGVTLVDYETGHWGDPAFDLGFFLSHLVLKAFKNSARPEPHFELTRVFWDEYFKQLDPAAAQVPSMAVGALTRRAIDHFALCALARIDGTSQVDYLPEEPKRAAVRELCHQVLKESPDHWETLLELAANRGAGPW